MQAVQEIERQRDADKGNEQRKCELSFHRGLYSVLQGSKHIGSVRWFAPIEKRLKDRPFTSVRARCGQWKIRRGR